MGKHWRERFTIDACMMVKNEARGIEKAIASIHDHVDQIHIIDTGSTDGTQEICKKFDKVKLYEEAPTLYMTVEEDGMDRIHFAKTRNRTLEKSKAKWILIIDGDEYFEFLEGFDLKKEVKHQDKCGADILGVGLVSFTDEGHSTEIQPRLVKNNRKIEYRYAVHNELDGFKSPALLQGLQLLTSYKKEDRSKEKEDRSLPILMKMRKEDPQDPRHAYYLQTLAFRDGDHKKAIEWAQECIKLCKNRDDRRYSARAWGTLVECEMVVNGLDAAEKRTYEALMHHPHCPDLIRVRVACALTRLDLALKGIYEDSQLYLSIPQKSFAVDTAEVAKALQINWPLVEVKVRGM